MTSETTIRARDTVRDELQDTLARVKAQTQVVRLAMTGMGDERDMRAIMACLNGIADDLAAAEALARR